jgi:hypothetical protein
MTVRRERLGQRDRLVRERGPRRRHYRKVHRTRKIGDTRREPLFIAMPE